MPEVLIIVDPSKEQIAVLESNKLRVPVVALVDTNCDPEPINYVIPGNDDALRSVRLIVSKLADAVIEGHSMRKQAEEQAAKEAITGEGEEKPAVAEAAPELPTGPIVRDIAGERKRERERADRDRRPGRAQGLPAPAAAPPRRRMHLAKPERPPRPPRPPRLRLLRLRPPRPKPPRRPRRPSRPTSKLPPDGPRFAGRPPGGTPRKRGAAGDPARGRTSTGLPTGPERSGPF